MNFSNIYVVPLLINGLKLICRSNELDYLEFRLWVGVWIAAILMILVATDASSLVRYITRFTEDNFATLIACIFMFEVLLSSKITCI